ncbi:hypothetical protein Tco_1307234 [Tanacetum coccineum]
MAVAVCGVVAARVTMVMWGVSGDGGGWRWRAGEDGSGGVVVAKGVAAMMSEMMDGVVGSLAGDGRRRRKNWPESKGAPELRERGEGGVCRVCINE